MASQKKIVEMITAIKTIYSYYAKDCDIELLVQTWGVLLRDYKDDIVDIAFYKAMQSCKVPPTPADIIERVTEMQKASEPTPESLWNELRAAIKETQKETLMGHFQHSKMISRKLKVLSLVLSMLQILAIHYQASINQHLNTVIHMILAFCQMRINKK